MFIAAYFSVPGALTKRSRPSCIISSGRDCKLFSREKGALKQDTFGEAEDKADWLKKELPKGNDFRDDATHTTSISELYSFRICRNSGQTAPALRLKGTIIDTCTIFTSSAELDIGI